MSGFITRKKNIASQSRIYEQNAASQRALKKGTTKFLWFTITYFKSNSSVLPVKIGRFCFSSSDRFNKKSLDYYHFFLSVRWTLHQTIGNIKQYASRKYVFLHLTPSFLPKTSTRSRWKYYQRIGNGQILWANETKCKRMMRWYCFPFLVVMSYLFLSLVNPFW